MSHDLAPPEPEDLRARRQRIFGQPPRRRRGRRALVAALLAIVAGGAVWSGVRMLHHGPAPGDVPIIRADDQPTRKRPSDPGGLPIPGRESVIYNEGKIDPKVERLLPPPETPLPRPLPPEPEPAASAPAAEATPSAASSPEPPAPAAAPAPPSVPAVAAAPPPPAEATRAQPPVPEPPPPRRAVAAAEPPSAAPPAPSKPAGGYRLQLGAVRSPDNAKHEWEKLKRSHTDILGTLAFSTHRVDLGERGIFYRIQAGPVRDAATAERDCGELKRRGVGCIIVKP